MLVTKIDSSPLMRLALAFLRGQGRSENTHCEVNQDPSQDRRRAPCPDTTWVESSLDQTMNINVMKFIFLLSPQAQAYEEWLPLIVVSCGVSTLTNVTVEFNLLTATVLVVLAIPNVVVVIVVRYHVQQS
jgi:hypothetical protein